MHLANSLPRRLVTLGLGLFLGISTARRLNAGDPWRDALAQMPLATGTTQLGKTNCVNVVLDAFEPNPSIKAIIFLPGATDELYFFDRVHARVDAAAPTLLDAITALTSQTGIHATFRSPFLLLHTTEESTEPWARIRHVATAERLRVKAVAGRTDVRDLDWDHLRPILRRRLGVGIQPGVDAPDSWHFYRANLRGWDLGGQELLEAVSFTTRTWFTVRWHRVIFERVSREEMLKRGRP